MKDITQLEVGKCFEVEGKRYMVFEKDDRDTCTGCAFKDLNCCKFERPFCSEWTRDDMKEVVFVEVE